MITMRCSAISEHPAMTFVNSIILSPQAQILLLIILLVAIVNVFVGTFIPATDDQKSKGIFNYDCKTEQTSMTKTRKSKKVMT